MSRCLVVPHWQDMVTLCKLLRNGDIFMWAGSKRSSNCPCRMIALRACLRIPYAVTCLAYAGDFSDMALREAYAGTFFDFFICPHRNCLREPVSTCAKPYTSKLNIYCVFVLITSSFIICFCQPFANCILAFAGIRVIQIPFASFRGGSFETNVLVHCSPPSVSSDTKACLGWHCGLGLRGPYAHLTRPLRGFHLHLLEISSWNLDPLNGSFLILPLSDLTRETLRNILSNKKLTPAYADLSFPYAGRPYDKAPT